MKKQIRSRVFESNSSSTHSLTITTEDNFTRWKNGELLFDRWNKDFVEPKTLLVEPSEDNIRNYYNENKDRY